MGFIIFLGDMKNQSTFFQILQKFLMVIQQPPMCLCVEDTKFNDDHHKLWWSCDQSRASEIEFFVWPALYDYKNGNLLIKGCVYTN
jgi:hypothetical protein